MIHYSAYLLLRMIKTFQQSRFFIPEGIGQEDVSDLEIITDHTTTDGHVAVIEFKGRQYVMGVYPVKEVEVKNPIFMGRG